MKDLVIGGKKFTNRFFLGTGKFASGDLLKQALAASGTELVTTALTRVERACMAVKPPTPQGQMAASAPPVTMASALPKRMRLKASAKALVLDAQAEVVV